MPVSDFGFSLFSNFLRPVFGFCDFCSQQNFLCFVHNFINIVFMKFSTIVTRVNTLHNHLFSAPFFLYF